MRSVTKLISWLIILVFLLSLPVSYSSAYESEDYHDLFIGYKNVDGMAASTYHIQINALFEQNPERFIDELSNEEWDTIVHHSLHLTVEQYYSNTEYTTYENFLSDQLRHADAGSKKAQTITVLLYGSILYQTTDTGKYQEDHQRVQAAFREDSRLFLTALSRYRYSSHLPDLVQSMMYQLDESGITDLNTTLSNAYAAPWATDEIRDLITTIQTHIQAVPDPPIDYDALFDQAGTLDGYLAEGYAYDMNQLFAKDPETFILELSDEPYETINYLAFTTANEQKITGMDAYNIILNGLESFYADNEKVKDTVYLMRMGILFTETAPKKNDPDYFARTYHDTVQRNFEFDSRLFLLSFSDNNSDSVCAHFADALMYELNDTKLAALDQELSACSSADWATDYVKNTISVIRDSIDKRRNPEPDPTEPDPTEPDPTVPSSGENSEPTEPKETPADSDPSNGWLIPVIIICATACTTVVVILIRKKK